MCKFHLCNLSSPYLLRLILVRGKWDPLWTDHTQGGACPHGPGVDRVSITLKILTASSHQGLCWPRVLPCLSDPVLPECGFSQEGKLSRMSISSGWRLIYRALGHFSQSLPHQALQQQKVIDPAGQLCQDLAGRSRTQGLDSSEVRKETVGGLHFTTKCKIDNIHSGLLAIFCFQYCSR